MYPSTSSVVEVLVTLSALTLTASACSKQGSTQITFYGFPDNDPPGPATAFNCGGRNNVAGGSGTFDDPVTFASATAEFNQCEVIYVPYLEKYARMEDDCQQCEDDFKNGGKRHIDMWTGSPSFNGGQDQINCEDALTPDGGQTIIRNPASNYAVDSSALYQPGAEPSCRNGKDTYPGNSADQFCSSSSSLVVDETLQSESMSGGGRIGSGGRVGSETGMQRAFKGMRIEVSELRK